MLDLIGIIIVAGLWYWQPLEGAILRYFFIDSTLPHLIHSQTYIEKPDPLMYTVHYETAIREPNKNINLHPKSEKYVLRVYR